MLNVHSEPCGSTLESKAILSRSETHQPAFRPRCAVDNKRERGRVCWNMNSVAAETGLHLLRQTLSRHVFHQTQPSFAMFPCCVYTSISLYPAGAQAYCGPLPLRGLIACICVTTSVHLRCQLRKDVIFVFATACPSFAVAAAAS